MVTPFTLPSRAMKRVGQECVRWNLHCNTFVANGALSAFVVQSGFAQVSVLRNVDSGTGVSKPLIASLALPPIAMVEVGIRRD